MTYTAISGETTRAFSEARLTEVFQRAGRWFAVLDGQEVQTLGEPTRATVVPAGGSLALLILAGADDDATQAEWIPERVLAFRIATGVHSGEVQDVVPITMNDESHPIAVLVDLDRKLARIPYGSDGDWTDDLGWALAWAARRLEALPEEGVDLWDEIAAGRPVTVIGERRPLCKAARA